MKNKKQFLRGIGIGLILSASMFYSIYYLTGLLNKNIEESPNEENNLSELTKKVNEIINTDNSNTSNSESNHINNDNNIISDNSINNENDNSTNNDDNTSIDDSNSLISSETNNNNINNKNSSDTSTNIVTNENKNISNDLNKNKKIDINIKYGNSSYDVAKILFNAGLIDNIDDFNRYCIVNNKSKYIQVGTFSIPKGSSYDEILDIIAN